MLVLVPILTFPAADVDGELATDICVTVAYCLEDLTLGEVAEPDMVSLMLVPSELVPVIV